jgi:hypothetical protein
MYAATDGEHGPRTARLERHLNAALQPGRTVKRRIAGYHQDEERHWVAELDCGHTQHVRHDPPWQVRPWVTSEEGRKSRLGTELDCRGCEEPS